ncbi:hypothetical protein HPB50_013292 [Hyalomma asiaticum]|uniref:Uncharacterized protein n=1 Tax=Hyalomma asiaticum TaxID=266040 RepID=A0ACB7T885_HYAAI|nr:hypothetical protein HPB50_013292 [Hyalomma asiaticum]
MASRLRTTKLRYLAEFREDTRALLLEKEAQLLSTLHKKIIVIILIASLLRDHGLRTKCLTPKFGKVSSSFFPQTPRKRLSVALYFVTDVSVPFRFFWRYADSSAFNFDPPGLALEMAVFYDADCKKSFTEALGTSSSLEGAIKTIISQVQVFYKPPWLKTPLHVVITELRLLDEEVVRSLYITWKLPPAFSRRHAVTVCTPSYSVSLGVNHDGPPENGKCSLDRYLMGPWRTSNTTTWWSECSLEILTKLHENEKMACIQKPPSVKRLRQVLHLNTWRNEQPPGQQWDADAQCRVFLKSEAARCSIKAENMSAVCRALQCKSPERIGLFGAGHALEGTYCGENSWCQGTKCVPFPKSLPVVPGGWTEWETVSECSQPCLQHSVALVHMKRACNDPRRQNTLEGCEGDNVRLKPCDINANKKAPKCTHPKTNQQYIDEKCAFYARFKPELKPSGTQVPHSAAQSWRACAIHCGYKSDAFIAAKFFLNELTNETGVLPDGARCHFDKSKGAAYYCQQGQCVTLLQSLAGIQDDEAGQVLEVEESDWAPDTEGRQLVERYLEYVPGKNFSVLDVNKVPRARARIAVDDL